MRVFVSGAEGFVGGHLIEHLLAQGSEVVGITLSKSLLGEHIPKDLSISECDVTDGVALGAIISRWSPDAIVHLAAMSSVSIARTQPEQTTLVNIMGTLNVLEAASRLSPKPHVIVVSTCEVYGAVSEQDCPIGEDTPVRPQNIYATTKAGAELLAEFYARAHDLPVLVLRPFNHTGPRQSPTFVCSAFARQIAGIEAGEKEPLMHVGNLDARRDFLDVRDVVRAYGLALAKRLVGGPYNVCSGRAVSIRDVLDVLLSLSEVEIEVGVKQELLRPLDIPLLVGEHTRFSNATGWESSIQLEKTLRDLLDYWRAQSPR